MRTLSAITILLVLARSLGLEAFGNYAAVFAVVTILSPLSTLGTGHLILKRLSNGEQPRTSFSEATTRIIVGTALTLPALVLVQQSWLPPIDWHVALLLGLAEFLFLSVAEMCALIAFAKENPLFAAQLRSVVAAIKMFGLLLFFSTQPSSGGELTTWVYTYTLSAGASCSICFWASRRRWGLSFVPQALPRARIFEGIPYTFNIFAAFAQSDADKLLLARMSGPEVAGFYSAAYRVVNLGLMPLRAGLSLTYPRLYRVQATNPHRAPALLGRYLAATTLFGVVSAAVLFFMAPLLPLILGKSYNDATPALVLLAWLPLARGWTYMLADFITTSGRQWWRVLIQASAATVSIGLNLLLIPTYSWRGSVVAAAVGELTAIVTLLLASAYVGVANRSTQTRGRSREER